MVYIILDMHMKLLDEETLLVGQYPGRVADGPQIEANLQYVWTIFILFGNQLKLLEFNASGSERTLSPSGQYRTSQILL